MPSSWLPPLLENTHADFQHYIDEAYGVFLAQLKNGNLSYNGRRLVLRREPITMGKENGFWHLIQKRDGSKREISEDNRIPDLNRMQRIVWINPIINALLNANVDKILVWKSMRPREDKTILSLIDFSYIVIIEHKPNKGYDILLTAYDVYPNRRGDQKKEYESYLKENKKT